MNQHDHIVRAPADDITRLKKLYELSMKLSGDPMDIFMHVAQMIGELLDVKVVCLSEIRNNELHFLSVYVQGQIYINAGSCSLDITPCATVERAKALRVIYNVAEQFPQAEFLKQHNAFSYCGFPALDNQGQVVAVTCLLDDRPHIFTDDDQELLGILGQRIGMEIERKRLDSQKQVTLTALLLSEQQNRIILDHAGDGIIILTSDGRIEGFNRAAQTFFAYHYSEIEGENITVLFSPSGQIDEQNNIVFMLKKAQDEGSVQPIEMMAYRKDHSRFPVEISISAAQLAERFIFTLIVRDITQRKYLQQKLSQTNVVFENTSEGIVITDEHNRIVAVNKALCAMTGYSESELLNQSPAIWQSGPYNHLFYQTISDSLHELGKWQGEIGCRCKNGQVIPLLQNINIARDSQGNISHYVAILTNITSIKRFEERLSHLAHYDPLTGLANRLLLDERLNDAMHQSVLDQQCLAVLLIDLDRFKNINDSFGHSFGNEILKKIANRIASVVKSSDTVARIGGDEFVIVLAELDNVNSVRAVANELLAILCAPIVIAEREFIITSSMGITLYPEDAQTVEDLLRHADTAMYHAKNQGRNNYQFYHSELGSKVYENLILENALHNAADRGELSLNYQPQFDFMTGRLVGAEALIRWHHPELGMISPVDFIPLAEVSGQIICIGEWVIRTACLQVKQWLDLGFDFGRIAVNVSALQIRQSNFAGMVANILIETGLSARHLELEVTESFVIEAEQTMPVLEALREMGVELAIDDFGTSYSSLKYLKTLPFDCLKIDQSFVKDIPNNSNDNAIARAVIALAKHLQLRVVAEGIETQQQKDFLLAEGCDCAQGYFFSRPIAADEFQRCYLMT